MDPMKKPRNALAGAKGALRAAGKPKESIGTLAPRTFRMVPDALWLDRRLRAADVRLWCSVLFTARGRAFTDATDAALADQLGLTTRSVSGGLARLEEAGYITRERGEQGRMIYPHPDGDGTQVEGLTLKVFG